MKTGSGATYLSDIVSPGGRIARAALTAVLGIVAALGLGELAISFAWLVVDWGGGHWRERTTGHALTVGGVLLVLLTLTLTASARSSVLVRAGLVVGTAFAFVLALAHVPLSIGGLKPSCVVVHVVPADFPPEILDGIGADAAGEARMELLYSNEGWHHFRQADGRHLQMPRERVVALTRCRELR